MRCLSRSSYLKFRTLLVFCFCALMAALPRWPLLAVSAASKQDEAAGAVLFQEKGCVYCHGPDARGTEKAPDLATVGKRLKREQIERQIHDGGSQMPAFGEALQPDEIKLLVDYLQTKRKAPAKSAQPAGLSNPVPKTRSER